MLNRLKKHKRAIIVAALVAGCTPVALPGLYGQWSIGCLLGACTCIRAIVKASVPTITDVTQFRDLDRYYETNGGGGYLHELSDPILGLTFLNFTGHWFPSNFYLRNRYKNYVMRNANGVMVRTNNYLGFHAATQLRLPPEWGVFNGQRVRIAAVKAAGGVKVQIKRPDEPLRTIIDSPEGRVDGDIARTLVCSDFDDEITARLDKGTELYLFSNMADGDSVEYNTAVGHGAFGSLEIRMVLGDGPLNPGGIVNTSLCGEEIYRDEQAYQAPQGAAKYSELAAKGYFNMPTAVYQVTDEHAQLYGMPTCPFEL